MPAAAAAPMQGTYIPQYTAVPASAITVEVRKVFDFTLLAPTIWSLACMVWCAMCFAMVTLAWNGGASSTMIHHFT